MSSIHFSSNYGDQMVSMNNKWMSIYARVCKCNHKKVGDQMQKPVGEHDNETAWCMSEWK